MKNQNTAIQKKEIRPIDTVRADLEKMKSQFAMALPKHITEDRLLRVALTCIQNTPKLLECDKTSLYAAIMTCAQLGLEPDGVLGHAYLIPYGNKVQFIAGYKGLLALARNSGEVVSISAHEVCQNDEFEYEYGLNEVLKHKPAQGNRGAIISFYAYAKFKDGGHHFDVMSLEDVEGIRDHSQGYIAAKKWKKESPWDTHFVEMGRKTLIRRIAKYLPLNVQRASSMEDYADMGKNTHLTEDGITIDGDFEEQKPSSKLQGMTNAAKNDPLNTSIDEAMAQREATADNTPPDEPASLSDRVYSMIAEIHMDREAKGTADYVNIEESSDFIALWAEVKKSGDKDLLGAISGAVA